MSLQPRPGYSEEGITVDQRYMEHTIQIAQQFESVFGEKNGTGRVRPVALWQQTTELTFFNTLAWAEQHFGSPVRDVLYGIGEAPYYTASDTSTVDATFATMWTGSDATRRDLIGWQAVAAFSTGSRKSRQGMSPALARCSAEPAPTSSAISA